MSEGGVVADVHGALEAMSRVVEHVRVHVDEAEVVEHEGVLRLNREGLKVGGLRLGGAPVGVSLAGAQAGREGQRTPARTAPKSPSWRWRLPRLLRSCVLSG